MRRASAADADAVGRWRNDVDTRAASRTSAEVTWQDHLAWFERRLADPNSLMLIGSIDARPMGIVRFDRTNDRTAEISINLAPNSRGKGIGKALLRAGCAFAQNAGFAVVFDAEILATNVSSQRTFEQAGFTRGPANGAWLKFQRSA